MRGGGVVYIVVPFRVGHLYVDSWQVRTSGQSREILNKMDKGLMVKMFAIVSCVWPENDQESLILYTAGIIGETSPLHKVLVLF